MSSKLTVSLTANSVVSTGPPSSAGIVMRMPGTVTNASPRASARPRGQDRVLGGVQHPDQRPGQPRALSRTWRTVPESPPNCSPVTAAGAGKSAIGAGVKEELAHPGRRCGAKPGCCAEADSCLRDRVTLRLKVSAPMGGAAGGASKAWLCVSRPAARQMTKSPRRLRRRSSPAASTRSGARIGSPVVMSTSRNAPRTR